MLINNILFSSLKSKGAFIFTPSPRCTWTIRRANLWPRGWHLWWRPMTGSIIWWLRLQRQWGYGWMFSSLELRDIKSSRTNCFKIGYVSSDLFNCSRKWKLKKFTCQISDILKQYQINIYSVFNESNKVAATMKNRSLSEQDHYLKPVLFM